MKLYKPTSKFLKNYKDTDIASYFISDEGKIYIRTYPDGKIDDDGNKKDWDDETLIMRTDEAEKEKYISIEDVLPFKINDYCMSADYGAVKIAGVEEGAERNVYYLMGGNRSITHYGSPNTLRYLTPEEMARYVS